MKYQLFFIISFACIFIARADETEPAEVAKVCEPGSVFKKDCNECKCNLDGTDMACTRKMCEGSLDGAAPVPEQSDNPAEKTAEDDDKCTPGETFKKDCNDCTCPQSGLKSAGHCTLILCNADFKKD